MVLVETLVHVWTKFLLEIHTHTPVSINVLNNLIDNPYSLRHGVGILLLLLVVCLFKCVCIHSIYARHALRASLSWISIFRPHFQHKCVLIFTFRCVVKQ